MKNQSQYIAKDNVYGFASIPGNPGVVISPIITLSIFPIVIGISAIISLLSIIILS